MSECLQDIRWQDYFVVGFTSVFSQQLASLLLAKRLKESYPGTKIVFGGANVHGSMGIAAITAFDWIDYVVDGEAEDVFPELVLRVSRNESPAGLPGISFYQGKEIQKYSGPVPLFQFGKLLFRTLLITSTSSRPQDS
jgi:radical SAM superfamily enzyme YgiQ (UPF0313 family)